MRKLLRARTSTLGLAAIMAMLLIVTSTTTVAGKPRPKPPPTPTPTPTTQPSGSVVIDIAATGTLEPNRQYAVVDVTVTCPTGWTWVRGGLYIRQADPGGSGSFSATCTGTQQVVHSRVVNGNKWTLGNATAEAFVTIARNGQEASGSSQRTIRLDPGVTARVADQGQLLDSAGAGARLAVAVACPSGATASRHRSRDTRWRPGFRVLHAGLRRHCAHVCRVHHRPQGAFQTGSATGAASASVGFSGQSFQGTDSRAITILQWSTGDTTKPSTPPT